MNGGIADCCRDDCGPARAWQIDDLVNGLRHHAGGRDAVSTSAVRATDDLASNERSRHDPGAPAFRAAARAGALNSVTMSRLPTRAGARREPAIASWPLTGTVKKVALGERTAHRAGRSGSGVTAGGDAQGSNRGRAAHWRLARPEPAPAPATKDPRVPLKRIAEQHDVLVEPATGRRSLRQGGTGLCQVFRSRRLKPAVPAVTSTSAMVSRTVTSAHWRPFLRGSPPM